VTSILASSDVDSINIERGSVDSYRMRPFNGIRHHVLYWI